MDPFKSVNDFLKAARSAKQDQKEAIDEGLSPLLDDPSTIGIPPSLLSSIETLMEKYGDEALRSTAMFCMGKWMGIHNEILQQHLETEDYQAALYVMADISKLSLLIRSMDEIGSFGGDDDWRKMIKSTVNQQVLEAMEERNLSIDDIIKGISDD